MEKQWFHNLSSRPLMFPPVGKHRNSLYPSKAVHCLHVRWLSVLRELRKRPKIHRSPNVQRLIQSAWVVEGPRLWPSQPRSPLRTITDPFFFHSPVKFVGGDCWPRGPTLTACPSHLTHSSVEQPMEGTIGEPMDTSSSSGSTPSEASAPLPIRHPAAGISAGPYKKHTYPMNSKRPEHLRMNLWRSAPPRTSGRVKVLPSAFLIG